MTKKALWAWMVVVAIPALVGGAIVRTMRGQWDDDDDDGYLDEVLDWFIGDQVRYAAAIVPIVGPAAIAIFNSFNNKPYDDKVSNNPAFGALDSAARAPNDIWKLAKGEGDWSRTIKDSFTAIGLVSGLPMGLAARPISYAADVAEGDVVPTSPLDYARGLVTGSPSEASRQ